MQYGKQVIEHTRIVWGKLCHLGHLLQHGSTIFIDDGCQQLEYLPLINGAQHGSCLSLLDSIVAKGNGLVSQAQGIAHAAISRMTQLPERCLFPADRLSIQHLAQILDYLLGCQVLEIELQAARQHSDGQLLRVGGGKEELHMFRRFFQCLEHGVEAAL